MAWRQGRRKEAESFDLRLRPQDRIGGPPKARSGSGRRQRDADTPAAPRKKRGGGRRSGFGRIVYWGLVLALWAIIAGIGALVWIGIHLPPIQSLEIPKRPPSVLILGVNGATLATRGDMGGAAVPLAELPAYVPNAFVAIEDRRFYSHHGIDPLGIARALVADVLRRGASQGGSTITQQLAKNLFLTQERTVSRKLQEIVLALWLEHKFTKAEILELYLNRVYFGSGAYGVEGASQRYFGKSARVLTLPEAAMLAGLVQSPSRLAPSHNQDGAQRRAAIVIADMAEQKMISDADAKAALAHPARAVQPAGAGSVNYVADWVMDAVDESIGQFDQDIVVETTIDPALQGAAEQALVDTLNAERRQAQYLARRAGGDDAGRRGARAGRRQELRREPIQPRHRRQAPARLGFQAVRLSHRARTRADAGHRARRRADLGQRLEAGKFRTPISRPGDADPGARQFAQYGIGAADARRKSRRRGAHRLSARHHLACSSPMPRSRSAPRK